MTQNFAFHKAGKFRGEQFTPEQNGKSGRENSLLERSNDQNLWMALGGVT